MTNKFQKVVSRLSQHYSERYARYGDTPAAVQQDHETQARRFEVLTSVEGLRNADVFDFGCGTGELFSALNEMEFGGTYTGYDIVPEMIEKAKSKFSSANFACRDIFEEGLPIEVDISFVNGVFNDRHSSNLSFMQDTLRILFDNSRHAIAFNALTTYVDYYDDSLYYANPLEVFDFCKSELSPNVTLRHDYAVRAGGGPFEFTVFVYKTGSTPRRNLGSGPINRIPAAPEA